MSVDSDEGVVHPGVAIESTVGTGTLSNLIFMVWKNQVLAAAMDVDGRAKVLANRGAAVGLGHLIPQRRPHRGNAGFQGVGHECERLQSARKAHSGFGVQRLRRT